MQFCEVESSISRIFQVPKPSADNPQQYELVKPPAARLVRIGLARKGGRGKRVMKLLGRELACSPRNLSTELPKGSISEERGTWVCLKIVYP